MAQNQIEAANNASKQERRIGVLPKMVKAELQTWMSFAMDSVDTMGAPIKGLQHGGKAKDIAIKVATFRQALLSPKYREQAIDEILADVVAGAFADRVALNAVAPTEAHEDDVPTLRSVQRMRQSADRHLLDVLKATKDIKRPPVQVVVQQAETVNVAGQVNQGERQVNIGKNEQPPK